MKELSIILLISLKVIFMYGAMQEGEVLFPLRQFFEYILSFLPIKVQQYARKPLFDCLFCMSSVWGIIFYFLPLPFWISIILSLAGLNYLWSALVGFLHASKDEAEAVEKRIEDLEDSMWPLGK